MPVGSSKERELLQIRMNKIVGRKRSKAYDARSIKSLEPRADSVEHLLYQYDGRGVRSIWTQALAQKRFPRRPEFATRAGRPIVPENSRGFAFCRGALEGPYLTNTRSRGEEVSSRGLDSRQLCAFGHRSMKLQSRGPVFFRRTNQST